MVFNVAYAWSGPTSARILISSRCRSISKAPTDGRVVVRAAGLLRQALQKRLVLLQLL
jgi:hypothetical protein